MAGYRKLGRTSSQRKALLRSQVTSLLYRGKIVTTEAKAKEIRSIAEGLIALAIKEKNKLHLIRVKREAAGVTERVFITELVLAWFFSIHRLLLTIHTRRE